MNGKAVPYGAAFLLDGIVLDMSLHMVSKGHPESLTNCVVFDKNPINSVYFMPKQCVIVKNG